MTCGIAGRTESYCGGEAVERRLGEEKEQSREEGTWVRELG